MPPEGQVFGAQMCAWEQPEKLEMPSLRNRLPAMAERIWNPDGRQRLPGFRPQSRDCRPIAGLADPTFLVKQSSLPQKVPWHFALPR